MIFTERVFQDSLDLCEATAGALRQVGEAEQKRKDAFLRNLLVWAVRGYRNHGGKDTRKMLNTIETYQRRVHWNRRSQAT
jgi:hypothetical protein